MSCSSSSSISAFFEDEDHGYQKGAIWQVGRTVRYDFDKVAMTTDYVEKQRKITVALLIFLYLFFHIFIIMWGHYADDLEWSKIWKVIEYEHSAVAWYSSVQLLLIGLVAYLTYVVSKMNDIKTQQKTPYLWVWLFLALGFVFLGCDEAFMYHEQLRDEILVPKKILSKDSNVRDVGFLLYLGAGLAMSYFFFQILRSSRTSVILFAGAILVIAPIVVLDTYKFDFVYSNWTVRHRYNIVEELGENLAELLFLLSFLSIFFDRLKNLFTPSVSGNATEPEALTSE